MSNDIATTNKRLETLEKICIHGRAIFFMVGVALEEIKFDELYKLKGFATFGEYCESIGYTKRHGNQLIFEANVVKDLPPELRELIGSEKAARELSKISPSLRPAVVAEAAAAASPGKPVTPSVIKRVSGPPPAPKNVTAGKPGSREPAVPAQKTPKPEKGPIDGTGLEIPKETRGLWEDATNAAQEMLIWARSIRDNLKKAKSDDDIIFSELRGAGISDAIAKADQLYVSLETAKPYAVCPSCSGKLVEGCKTCRERGFISRFYWDHNIDPKVKKMREG